MVIPRARQKIATFFLILMCVQFIPLEGYGVSYIKFAAMCFAPLILLFYSPKISKAFIWGGLYILIVILSAAMHLGSFRLSTIGYLISFIFMFVMYYNLVYLEHAFSLDFFIKVIKGLIVAYTIGLVLQQILIILGIRSFPIINLAHYLDRGIGSNSLALEPSHSARIMTALLLSLLRMYEIKWGKGMTITRLFKGDKWVIIGFLWSMLTMGSGTAFVGLGLLSLYFIKKQYVFTIVPLLIVLYFAIPHIDFEPLDRAKATYEAAITLDQAIVKKADYSAAARVVPLINTFTELDLSKKDTWYGNGIDSNVSDEYLSENQTIGGINDYGLISYIISLIFVFSCCIKKLLSLETLIFIFLLAAGIGNIAYVWGILMLFATTKYFSSSKINKKISSNSIRSYLVSPSYCAL